jgi:hypothetical protein
MATIFVDWAAPTIFGRGLGVTSAARPGPEGWVCCFGTSDLRPRSESFGFFAFFPPKSPRFLHRSKFCDLSQKSVSAFGKNPRKAKNFRKKGRIWRRLARLDTRRNVPENAVCVLAR